MSATKKPSTQDQWRATLTVTSPEGDAYTVFEVEGATQEQLVPLVAAAFSNPESTSRAMLTTQEEWRARTPLLSKTAPEE
jgi:hypothetical protein